MGLWSKWIFLMTIITFLATISITRCASKLVISPLEYDPRTPLMLSPLIDAGQLQRARTWSRVNGVPGMNRKSYSGFLTTRPEDEANLFFWFFPADVNSSSAPVLLWVNGGPGSPALGGLFGETGPYTVKPDLKLEYRPHHWETVFNMLYIDCPVGTGYSYAKSFNEYSNSTDAVARDLYPALVQFFTIFDDYSGNDFYVAGESYGARYCISLAKIIHHTNPDSKIKIRLKGVLVLATLIRSETLSPGIEYVYQLGLLGPDDYEAAKLMDARYVAAYQAGNYTLAAYLMQDVVLSAFAANGTSLLSSASGITTGENILLTEDPRVFQDFAKFVQKPCVRLAIHVGNRTFSQYNKVVLDLMLHEYVQRVDDGLEELLDEGYKVLMMSGNLDLFISPILYRNLTFGLQWNHTESFRRSSRVIWKVDPRDVDVAGYANCDHNLCLVLVRNAGHRIPNDQVRSTLDAARRFAFDIPFN